MNKIEAFKLAARVIVGAGTTVISKNIIQNNVRPANTLEAFTVGAASVVIGSMASEATRTHTDTQIDAIVAAWKNATSKETTTPV